MDQLPQRAFIKPETIRCIEAPRASAAQCATAFEIQGKRIQERRLALHAEIRGGMRARPLQACGAHGHTSIAAQRLAADAAFIGEQD